MRGEGVDLHIQLPRDMRHEEGHALEVERLAAALHDRFHGGGNRFEVGHPMSVPQRTATGQQGIERVGQPCDAAGRWANPQQRLVDPSLHLENGNVAAGLPRRGPGSDGLGRDGVFQSLQQGGVLVGACGQGRAETVWPEDGAAPADRCQRLQRGDHPHGQHGVGLGFVRCRFGRALAQHVLDARAQTGIAEAAPQPVRHSAVPERSDTAVRLLGDRMGEGSGVPGGGAADGQRARRLTRGTGRDPPAARGGGVEQHGGGRAVIRVLGQHAAGEIGDQRGQARVPRDGGEAAEFELATQHGGGVEAGERFGPRRQRDQQAAEGIDVVGDGPVPSAGRVAHQAIEWFVSRRLVERRWRGPGATERDRLVGRLKEDVIRPDGAVCQVPGFQFAQRLGDGAEELSDQRGLGPGSGGNADGRTRRHGADDGEVWHRATAEGDEQVLHGLNQIPQYIRPHRRCSAHCYGHKVGAAGLQVRGDEGWLATATGQGAGEVDDVTAGCGVVVGGALHRDRAGMTRGL